jgi:hypothetical protein
LLNDPEEVVEVEVVDLPVAGQNSAGENAVSLDERLLRLLQDTPRHVCHFRNGGLFDQLGRFDEVARVLGQVLRVVSDPLEIRVDLDGKDDKTEVYRYRIV